jgi:8-oxo-dGTP pyrophosphatase MutT (NUDIX family)
MSENKYLFQYCQKIVVFNKKLDAVLLARRQGEADFDSVYSFIGGKMEVSDIGLIEGLKREKDEEIGKQAVLEVITNPTYNLLFTKSSGQKMILPHYAGVYKSGNIILNEEYSEYKWINLSSLKKFEPKIANIPEVTEWAKRLLELNDSVKVKI